MFSLALKLVLRRIDASAILVLMLAPTVVLLVGSSIVVGGFANQAQSVASLVPSGQRYAAYPGGNASTIDYSVFTSVSRMSGVVWALPFLVINDSSFPIIGTNISDLAKLNGVQLDGAVAGTNQEVDVGAISAKALGVNLGGNITIRSSTDNVTLRVAGILNSSSQYDAALLIPLESAWRNFPQYGGRVTYFEFALAPGSDAQTRIRAILLLPDSVDVVSEQGLGPTLSSFANQLGGLLAVWSAVLLALSSVIAVSAAFRVVAGASDEYRVARAIGARNSVARALVFYELLIISLIAVVAGIGGGVAAAEIFSAFVHALTGVALAPLVDPLRIALLALGSLLFILGAGAATLLLLFRERNSTTTISLRGSAVVSP